MRHSEGSRTNLSGLEKDMDGEQQVNRGKLEHNIPTMYEG